MTTTYKATARFFKDWYIDQRTYTMHRDDWLYIVILALASLVAFGLGLLIGLAWIAIL